MSHFSHQTSGWIVIESDSSFRWTNADNFYKSLFSSPPVSRVCAQGDEKDWALPPWRAGVIQTMQALTSLCHVGFLTLAPPLNTMKIQAFPFLALKPSQTCLRSRAALPADFRDVLTSSAWTPEPNGERVHLPLCLTITEGISKSLGLRAGKWDCKES